MGEVMSNKDKILNFLKSKKGLRYCDDCLSKILKITPRQQINRICRMLSERGRINRERGLCSQCSKYKLVNWVGEYNTLSRVREVSSQELIRGKRLHYRAFEDRVANYLYNKFNKKFYREKSLKVGPNTYHKFDMVSEDGDIVVECKSYKWTESGNFPSAKISTAIEDVFYLTRIKAKKKILVFQDDFNSKGESLVDVFVRRYDGILDDIEVWAYNVGESLEKDHVRIARKPKDSWYKKIYCYGMS